MQTVGFGNRIEQSSNQLWVTEYIQSERQVDSGNLLRLLRANWSPVGGKLVRNNAYREWSRLGPAYWHAHVHDKPAVAASAWQACVFSQIHRIWIRSFGLEVLTPTENLDVSASCHTL
jgi:hypothetical protein